jgi:phosphoribosylaminoimidazole carboxylase
MSHTNDVAAPEVTNEELSAFELLDRPLRVACIGGGQLGRMMGLEAPRLNIQMFFLDPAGDQCPAASIVPSDRIHTGSLQDRESIQKFLSIVQPDVVTAEIEHINCDAIQQALETNPSLKVRPSCAVVQLIQDKYQQKLHFQSQADIPIPPFRACPSVPSFREAISQLGLPIMLKSRTGAYDGRGNAVLKVDSLDAIHEALRQLGVHDPSSNTSTDFLLYAEGWIDFVCEIAVMVVRSPCSQTKCYPAVNAIQQNSICRVVFAPVRSVAPHVKAAAEALAIRAIDSLPGKEGVCGIFGVEMFVTRSGEVLLNEIAPRPHNTGHYTQDACYVSQFENHLRAVCHFPLGSTQMKVPVAAMVNVLGSDSMTQTLASSNAALRMNHAVVHWYGKVECRTGRKMGHINLTAHTEFELDIHLYRLLELEGIDASLISMVLKNSSPSPLVSVIMGSHSDLPTMQAAVDVLKQFHVPYEVDIVSAHRTPDKLLSYARSAADRGLVVIIAGAGGAAHLPGMVAAMTPLPVIGVPVKTSTLSGVDSLYSIVQMPKGVPVATVAIGNATNAGLLAVRILSTHRPELLRQMMDYQTDMKEMVDEVSSRLLDMGSDAFLEQMENKNTSVNV